MRQIVLDTETTGLSPASGHRIIELACIELVDRKKTGNRFHHYINPERESDSGALKVHGLSSTFLAGKPKFSEIVDSFIEFVHGAELIIHNAPFDMGFLNSELKLAGMPTLDSICADVCDTLPLARRKHPGKKIVWMRCVCAIKLTMRIAIFMVLCLMPICWRRCFFV